MDDVEIVRVEGEAQKLLQTIFNSRSNKSAL